NLKTALARSNLGFLLLELEDFPAARVQLEEALRVQCRLLGENHPKTACAANNLGLLLQRVDEGAAAREHFTRAVQSWKNGPTPDDPRAVSSLYNLGMLEFAQGNHAAARKLLEQALDWRLRRSREVLASLSEAEALRYAQVSESIRDPLLS